MSTTISHRAARLVAYSYDDFAVTIRDRGSASPIRDSLVIVERAARHPGKDQRAGGSIVDDVENGASGAGRSACQCFTNRERRRFPVVFKA